MSHFSLYQPWTAIAARRTMKLSPLGLRMVGLLCGLLVGETKSRSEEENCPSCEKMFSKLKSTGVSGKLVQDVKIQERGEPKSGTGFMFDWGAGALDHMCDYLKETFGSESCRVEIAIENPRAVSFSNRTMIFEPALASDNARCACDNVERVSIAVSKLQKHVLPVSDDCAYRHGPGIDTGENRKQAGRNVCMFADGTPILKYEDLRRCMQEASCAMAEDGWLQMAVFRDPRPMAMSAYYHIKRHPKQMKLAENGGTMEEFVARVLPIMSQWVAVRHILFEDFLSTQSTSFWYNDALVRPRVWHDRWLDLAGVQPPLSVVEDALTNALEGKFYFGVKQRDKHPGAETKVLTGLKVRRFEDEVSAELLETADNVLRTWLAPTLLAKIGVTL